MRRFSKRSSLVTLSEINITPLLDLAFVLLIIFVITTPLIEQSIEMTLPRGGSPDRPMNESDVRTVEVHPQRGYFLDGTPMTLQQIEATLIASRANPNLVVRIRADRGTFWDHVFRVTDICANHGIRVSFRSEPLEVRR
jgi:biopolymer transport protein ExbD